jgi:hypothetical protein
MLMNNLDPEVAERPEQLIVYGGIGKAARNWECFDAIVATPRACLEAAAELRQGFYETLRCTEIAGFGSSFTSLSAFSVSISRRYV